MADSVNKILWKFFGDTKNLDKSMKRTRSGFKDTQKAGGRLSGAFNSIKGAAVGLGAALGAREIIGFANDAVQMAIAAEEVDSKFQAVYGTAEELTGALSAWADMAGITDTAARDMAGTFGNLAMAQGVSADDTEALVLQVATLAGDMASFNDSDPEQVFEDLNKALLTTEREGMKKYGIAISEAEVKTRALRIATADGRDEVTQADRAMASYEIAVSQAGKAVGDLERTQDSSANRQRRLSASWKEFQEQIGKELLPAFEDLLELAEDLTPALVAMADAAGGLGTELSTATGAVNDFIGDGEGGILGGAAAIGRLAWEQTKFIPGLNLLDRALRENNVDLGIMAEKSDDAAEATGGIKYALSGMDDDLYGYGAAAAEAAGQTGDLAGSAWNAEAALSDLRREIGYFEAGKAGREAIVSGTGGLEESERRAARGYATGGVVPGQRGQAQLAVVHGGEMISTPMQQRGGGASVVVNFNGVVGDPVEVAAQIQDLIELYGQSNGLR